MEERKFAYRILVEKPESKDRLEDTGVDESIILRWIFRKWFGSGEHVLDLSGL